MSKIFLIILISVTTCIFFLLFFLEEKQPKIYLPDIDKYSLIKKTHPIIDAINNDNQKIQTFICRNISITTWQGKKRVNLTGSLYYKKPNCFRMEIFWKSNKETDIGSNTDVFWYWAKREKYPALYWATHEEFSRSRLKTPFNPNFIKSSLGFDEIKHKDIFENSVIIATIPQLDGIGQTVILQTIIENQSIKGLKITRNNQLLAMCEIKNRNPLQIVYYWTEEDKTVLMQFNNYIINQEINNQEFVVPDYRPKINMAK